MSRQLTRPRVTKKEQSFLMTAVFNAIAVFIVILAALITYGYFQRNPDTFSMILPDDSVAFVFVAFVFIIVYLCIKLVQYRLKAD